MSPIDNCCDPLAIGFCSAADAGNDDGVACGKARRGRHRQADKAGTVISRARHGLAENPRRINAAGGIRVLILERPIREIDSR